jgi:DNA repair photolyase
VKPRDVSNPLNRFRELAVRYDDGEGPPPAKVTILEDSSRSILSRNDSPDLGFRWSANPYRGCLHACAYCLDPETPILMGDGRTRALAALRVGDEIIGTTLRGRYRRYTRTRVLAHWQTRKLAYRVELADGTQLIASGEHRFLTERGWKHVMPAESAAQRPYLTTNNHLVGVGAFAPPPVEDESYRRGYLCGMIRGHGTLRRYDYAGGRRDGVDTQHQFRLALIDLEALARSRRYLADLAVATQEIGFAVPAGQRPMRAIRSSSRSAFERISAAIAWPDAPDDGWRRGLLAGIFDAEGSRSQHVLRISNMDPSMIEQARAALVRFGFDPVIETQPREPRPIFNVRVRGGLPAHLRFLHATGPAITRKWDLEGRAMKYSADLRVVSIEPVGVRELYDITTGTEDFIANGVVSHNCYARPTHEYLDLGAGTDFDTKLVVKREAPELLREAFDRPSWKGERVMFSGVTDCYQPIEKELEITRRCLEVCLEYRNPVSVISKSALVLRDVDLFRALAAEARFHLAVSLAFTDDEQARAIEPWATSPTRRLKVIEALAKAGVPVSVMIAPVIPGVNDGQMVGVLERAAAAGAASAGWTLLRLPGAVKDVFEERLRALMPLAADKVLHRIRETRGGDRLYDARFHRRGRGEGPYAEALATMFTATCKRLGFSERHDEDDPAGDDDEPTTFRRPPPRTGQLSLF